MLRSHNDAHNVAILCKQVTKEFYVFSHRTNSLREWFIRTLQRKPKKLGFSSFSIKKFDLCVEQGDSIAFIGLNGCGKSTALRLIAGVYAPTDGTVQTFGQVGSVIELGAGFNQELTGAENIALYGAIMGLTRKQLASKYDEIVAFSGIEDFIQLPIKHYSSGMVARLAFSVAVNLNPDVLLLDEVLAVGDQAFQTKCIERLRAFRSEGGTMVVVSHNFQLVSQLCSRAVWLENGEIRMIGEISFVLEAYQQFSKNDVK